jgi:hypothetical protein
VVQRDTMRQCLAIDAHLASLAAPRAQRVWKHLRDWLAATERYALQLNSMHGPTRWQCNATKSRTSRRASARGPGRCRRLCGDNRGHRAGSAA